MWSIAPTPSGPTKSAPLIAFTTPANYAGRLSEVLRRHGLTPLPTPTLHLTPTPLALLPHLQTLGLFSAVAFTSRSGISSFSSAATALSPPLLPPHAQFTVAALGTDAELIDEPFLSSLTGKGRAAARVRVLVPPIATPMEMARSLGDGEGRRILCPVPVVTGLEEPPVVPEFLRELEVNRWVPVRGGAYETRWAGSDCARELAAVARNGGEVAGMVFTSTAEVEGLLKGLRELGVEWREVRERWWPRMVVAAHGPVTTAGAERLGVQVDVVSQSFGSFEGVVSALCLRLGLIIPSSSSSSSFSSSSPLLSE